jgi:hypothetical protein
MNVARFEICQTLVRNVKSSFKPDHDNWKTCGLSKPASRQSEYISLCSSYQRKTIPAPELDQFHTQKITKNSWTQVSVYALWTTWPYSINGTLNSVKICNKIYAPIQDTYWSFSVLNVNVFNLNNMANCMKIFCKYNFKVDIFSFCCLNSLAEPHREFEGSHVVQGALAPNTHLGYSVKW